MSPRTRRLPTWFEGSFHIAAAAAIAVSIGLSLGARLWASYVGLFALALLGMGGVERAWRALSARRPPRGRDRFRVVQGGRLDRDELEDDRPRWLH